MQDPTAAPTKLKPVGFKEFTPRAVLCGFLVAAIMGASYPYVVLKLGFGPNVSVVAAILGYVILGLFLCTLCRLFGIAHTPYNRWENNIVQTAGTAASQTAFMCVLLAAFDLLAMNKTMDFKVVLTPIQSFAWLSTAGLLGILLAVPLRRHYIDDEKLPYADGIAAGETLIVCDNTGATAKKAAFLMMIGIALSGFVMAMNTDSHLIGWIESTYVLPLGLLAVTKFGIEWSLLAIGSGMIIGLRINVSMLLGSVMAWIVAPYALRHYGLLPEGFKRQEVLFWIMWPATGMMVAGGLASLALRWKALSRTFSNLKAGAGTDDFPLKWVVFGCILTAGGLVAVQHLMLGQPIWITVVALLCSAPLALVGLRVLGETNWGPISALSNMMQGFFALIAPGNVPANMMASGTTGTVATCSEAIMQDYRSAAMVGTSPRYMTYMQLLSVPIGAAAVSWMYPLLKSTYGIGEDGLSSPISQKWAGFAAILSKGTDALPPGAFAALIVGAMIGVILAVLESRVKNKNWVPSPTGMGIGMLVPASVIVSMFVGSVIGWFWTKFHRASADLYMMPLASGLIAGEALIAVMVPILAVLGIIKA